ncbi:hypothetical protein U1Q18_049810, partial [Sarracenia purpurea var. burkii]
MIEISEPNEFSEPAFIPEVTVEIPPGQRKSARLIAQKIQKEKNNSNGNNAMP